MKQTGMLAVSLRGANLGFWSCLGCSGQSANILCRQSLVWGSVKKQYRITQTETEVKFSVGNADINTSHSRSRCSIF